MSEDDGPIFDKDKLFLSFSLPFFIILLYLYTNLVLINAGVVTNSLIIFRNGGQIFLGPFFMSALFGLLFSDYEIKKLLYFNIFILVSVSLMALFLLRWIPPLFLHTFPFSRVDGMGITILPFIFILIIIMTVGNTVGQYAYRYLPQYSYIYDQEKVKELNDETEEWYDYLGKRKLDDDE